MDLLDVDEQAMFRNVGFDNLEVRSLSAEWVDAMGLFDECTYRLKLKEGEWYFKENEEADEYLIKINSFCSDGSFSFYISNTKPFDKDLNGRTFKSNIADVDAKIFRPATKEEIEAVKPKETFVDVEVKWTSGMVEAKHPENKKIYNISAKPVGWTLSGWALSCYIHKYKGRQIDNYPILWNSDGTEIVNKATHARFVKIEN